VLQIRYLRQYTEKNTIEKQKGGVGSDKDCQQHKEGFHSQPTCTTYIMQPSAAVSKLDCTLSPQVVCVCESRIDCVHNGTCCVQWRWDDGAVVYWTVCYAFIEAQKEMFSDGGYYITSKLVLMSSVYVRMVKVKLRWACKLDGENRITRTKFYF
jgi:hypothetical protein